MTVKKRLAEYGACIDVGILMLMTLYGFAINSVTIANNDYKAIVLQAVGCSGLGILLVFVIWRRVAITVRFIVVLCGLVNLWTLFDAGVRRLPAVMEW